MGAYRAVLCSLLFSELCNQCCSQLLSDLYNRLHVPLERGVKPAFLRAVRNLGSLSEEKAAGALESSGLAFSLPWRFRLTDMPSHNLGSRSLALMCSASHTHTHTPTLPLHTPTHICTLLQKNKNTHTHTRPRAHILFSFYIFSKFSSDERQKRRPAHDNLRYLQLRNRTGNTRTRGV